jgi:deoxyribodipyrimidine photo-lyase
MSNLKSIFIFHRSLRLDDNNGLIEALKNSEKVIPIFIFTPEQIGSKNKYRSVNSIVFMLEALQDLNSKLKDLGSKLYIFYGEQSDILKSILKQDDNINAVYVNEDYTQYAQKREEKLKKITEQFDREFFSFEDYLLHDINTIVNKSGENYSVFTPFYHNALKYNVEEPIKNKYKNYISSKYILKGQTTFEKIKKIYHNDQDFKEEEADFEATRKEALKRLNNIKNHKNYARDRDDLSLDTTRLSPYIKFGLVSIREVYHKIKKLFGKKHDLIRQLYWRDFYYNIAFNRPDIFSGKSFRKSYDRIEWWNDNKLFNKWKNGETGYPIVDAGMRELNQTGYMHNRTRLITSNFLVKHLFIDWRKGEKYFASKLIDYDPSVNNGNWQFSSGSGGDSQPYFRMINPWLQSEKHDPECLYIKKWIPELRDISCYDIHNWNETYQDYDIDYPDPCVEYDFNKLKKLSKKVYSKAFSRSTK